MDAIVMGILFLAFCVVMSSKRKSGIPLVTRQTFVTDRLRKLRLGE